MGHLHITNGDCAGAMLREIRSDGPILPWRDMLHEGPVPADLSLTALWAVRTEFLVGFIEEAHHPHNTENADVEAMQTALSYQREIQTHLHALSTYESITLWFEHDLYDQLQILQILALFNTMDVRIPISMICIDHFPGVPNFKGLGNLSLEQLAGLDPAERRPVTSKDLALASEVWSAFTAPQPQALAVLLDRPPATSDFTAWDQTAFPFLSNALLRWCQEFPWTTDGLDQTQRHLLQFAATPVEATGFPALFQALQDREAAPFHGDLSVLWLCRKLASGPRPLFEAVDAGQTGPWPAFRVTAAGMDVLAGEADQIDLNGVDRHRGGVHLTSSACIRWDDTAKTFVASDP